MPGVSMTGSEFAGHYHALVDDEPVNEPRWNDFAEALRGTKRHVADLGWVCTHGCGRIHPLTKDEQSAVRNIMSKTLPLKLWYRSGNALCVY